jgi:hypothetical protein
MKIVLTRKDLLPSARLLPLDKIVGMHQFNIKATDWNAATQIEYNAPGGNVKVLKNGK